RHAAIISTTRTKADDMFSRTERRASISISRTLAISPRMFTPEAVSSRGIRPPMDSCAAHRACAWRCMPALWREPFRKEKRNVSICPLSWSAMILGKKVVVVMPAYNAELTIEKTWREVLDQEIVDLIIVVDDASQDRTVELARRLDRVVVHVHAKNRG